MQLANKRRAERKISVVGGLRSALGANLAVGNTECARRLTLSDEEHVRDILEHSSLYQFHSPSRIAFILTPGCDVFLLLGE